MCADRMTQLPIIPEHQATVPPVVVLRPMTQTAPVVFASAHSGRQYSADFIAASRLQLHALRRSEDSFVEELYQAAPGLGAPMVVANFPRAYCDANREKWELDPAMFTAPLPDWVNTTSARVGAGLGTVARIVASGETIYRGKLDFSEVQTRIAGFWQPFHDALKAEISTTSARFGRCLLVDCHSMPGTSQGRLERADIILGDIHGTSCAPRIVGKVEERLISLGFRVRRNDPYAGGYITRHYGRPREGVHALQIEICRTLYMDEPRLERLAGFDAMQARITRLVSGLIEENGFFSDI